MTLESRVLAFARSRENRNFYISELLTYVRLVLPGTAPDSPSRVLRQLRAKGRIFYHVVRRDLSLYRMDPRPWSAA